MGECIDLLKNYPKTRRNVKERGATKTNAHREIARQFGKEFFDGDRKYGYGGFSYQEKFWSPVVPTFQEFYRLTKSDSVLDVGCAKGFMLYDFQRLIPGLKVAGVDISEYAIDNALIDIRRCVQVANATCLPYEDDSFDLVISVNTIHNLEVGELVRALQEIERVSRRNSFVTVDAYNSDEEKEAMYAWNLTAKTILSVAEWKTLFWDAGYTGDYYWFTP